MEDKHTFQAGVSERIAGYLERKSQTFSRRGLLVSTGKLILRLSGLALLPLLPIDRRAYAQFACDWTTCNMCGNFCNSGQDCCFGGGSGGLDDCPSCMTTFQAWSGCCFPDACAPSGTIFSYIDCGTGSASQAAACQSPTRCTTGCPQAFWHNASAVYSCTIISIIGTC
jgi:hypothetical protein